MRIGLLLGSFDPPHIGHLWAAYYALNNGMDEVWVIPAWENPWKTNQTPFKDRLKMCELCFSNREKTIIVKDSDGDYKSHYTYEGLEKLLENSSSDKEYFIIGGTDVARSIANWKHGDWILKNFNILEVPRSGYKASNLGIECSSSVLRQMISEGKSTIPFINNETLTFIKDNNLYA